MNWLIVGDSKDYLEQQKNIRMKKFGEKLPKIRAKRRIKAPNIDFSTLIEPTHLNHQKLIPITFHTTSNAFHLNTCTSISHFHIYPQSFTNSKKIRFYEAFNRHVFDENPLIIIETAPTSRIKRIHIEA